METGRREIGLYFLTHWFPIFFGIGKKFVLFFHFDGKMPYIGQYLQIILKSHIISSQWALFESTLLMTLYFLTHWFPIFFGIGKKFVLFFHFDGKMPYIGQYLQIILKSHIISSQWALFESTLLMTLLRSSTKKSASKYHFFMIKGKSDGNVLPLSINEHCFANILLFSLDSVIDS